MQLPVTLLASAGWPADLHIWHVEIPSADIEIALTGLDADECARAERYLQPADRRRFVVTRSTLRDLLGHYLDRPPAALRFATTRYGRPELLDGRGLSFNVSHAGDHALLAISRVRKVGIDIERIDPELDWSALANRVCTADEHAALMTRPAACRREGFYRCWTAKEAVLKSMGRGIGDDLHALHVGFGEAGVRQPVAVRAASCVAAQRMRVHWLAELPGYIGCVAFGDARQVSGRSARMRRSV